jgi:hypothetical protein
MVPLTAPPLICLLAPPMGFPIVAGCLATAIPFTPPRTFPPLLTVPAIGARLSRSNTAPRWFPAAVLRRPPLAVAPFLPTPVILPLLSLVIRFVPRCARLAAGLALVVVVPVEAKRPRPSRT